MTVLEIVGTLQSVNVQRRVDGILGAATRTGSGGVRVPAFVCRTGVQTYRDANGAEIREYRPESEVFAPESLETLDGVAVTVRHPPEGSVNPDNWPRLAKGSVAAVNGRERADDGQEYVAALLDLATSDVISRVDSRDLSELSAGYQCEVIEQPGRTDSGEPYDRIQTKIRYNHVALLGEGQARAGRQARLRLDGNEELPGDSPANGTQPDTVERTPMKIRLDSIEYDLANESSRAAFQKALDDTLAAREAEAKRADEAVARADAATARADAAEQQVARLPEMVAQETQFRADLADILGAEYRFDGKTPRQVRLDAIAKLDASAQLTDEHSDDYVTAYLDAIRRTKPNPGYRGDSNESDRNDSLDSMIQEYHRRLDSAFGGSE